MNSSVIMDDDIQTINAFEPTRMASRQITLSQFNEIEISQETEKFYLQDIQITRIVLIGFVIKCSQISKGINLNITDGTSRITVLYFPPSDNLNTLDIEESSLIKITGKFSYTNDQRACIAKHISICNDFNELSLHLASSLVINKWINNEIKRDTNSSFNELEETILKYIKENKRTLKDQLIEDLSSFNKEHIENSLKKLLNEKFINLDKEDGILSPCD